MADLKLMFLRGDQIIVLLKLSLSLPHIAFSSLLCIVCACFQQVLASELHVHGGSNVLEVVRAVGRSAGHLVRLAQQPHRGLQDSHSKPTFFIILQLERERNLFSFVA